MKRLKNKPELLAPAGNFEKLKIAIHYGADAVYLGGNQFSLRANAGNFSIAEIEKGIEYAHANNVKVYVAVNAFFRNADVDAVMPFLKEIKRVSPDAVIVADPGIVSLIKETTPALPIHLSTQSNTTNWKTCEFWKQQGVERIGLARELSFNEIKGIREKENIELEIFIHGAMCISYSGRCWMSKYMAERDANAGDCAQACRWEYSIMEKSRPGEYFYMEEDIQGTYLYNSKDLCLIEHVPELMELGIDSFKIEGRMKSINYLATVVGIYRHAIDTYWQDPEGYLFDPLWLKELKKVSNRNYTTGFYREKPSSASQNAASSTPRREYDFVGLVIDTLGDNKIKVQVKNKIIKGDEVEIFGKGAVVSTHTIKKMITGDGKYCDMAQPNDIVTVQFSSPVKRHSIIRRKKPRS